MTLKHVMILCAAAIGLAVPGASPARAAAQEAQPQAGDPAEKLICVREDITGSLARKRKMCHTQREWAGIRYNAEQEARRISQAGTLNDLNVDPPGSGNLP